MIMEAGKQWYIEFVFIVRSKYDEVVAHDVTFETIESGNLNMELYNSIGQKVLSIENKEISAGKYSYQLNALNDVSGIYILKIGNEYIGYETSMFSKQ